MSTEDAVAGISDEERKKIRYHFDRHAPGYRERFEDITHEMHARCPIAWTDTHGGHWVAAGNREVFELAAPERPPEHHANDEDQHHGQRHQQVKDVHAVHQASVLTGLLCAAAGPEVPPCRRNAFSTTSKELADMPMPAIHGVTRPHMASGIAVML